MTITREKVKLDFSKPHITYREKNGQVVVGTTTAINKLAMPALPIWGFNTGREPMYQTIPEAIEAEGINPAKLKKAEAIPWAFSAGQKRKNSNLYGKRDKAAEIGTIAHEILHYREKGLEIDNSNIDDDVWELALKCVASHDQWFQNMTMKTILTEKDFVSEKYHYGGTMDKLAEINGELTLIDYKTGKDIYDTNFIQLAAYTNLAIEQGYDVKQSIAVNMPKTKGNSFNIKSVPAEMLFEAGYFKWFLSSVDAYYAEQQTKKFKEVI
jgi:hypothetical protein